MPARAKQNRKQQPAIDTYGQMRNVAIVFWDNLVSFYEGKPLSASINEKLCMSVIKHSAKKAAEGKLGA